MRLRLLDAAESIYATEGPAGLTNRRIVAEARTTTQSIYTYFGGRGELIDQMYRRAIVGARELVEMALGAAPGDPADGEVLDAFKGLARLYRSYCLQYPGRFRLIRTGGAGAEIPQEAALLRTELVDALVSFGRSGGGWEEPEYEGRVHLTLSAVHGFILAEHEGFVVVDHDPDRLFDELVHRCLIQWPLIEGL